MAEAFDKIFGILRWRAIVKILVTYDSLFEIHLHLQDARGHLNICMNLNGMDRKK